MQPDHPVGSVKGEKLFTFAVIADSHINPQDDASSSPWPSNRFANLRSQRAVAKLNQLKPEFVVHLGDLVHPVPALDTFDPAATRFQEIYAELESPMHLVAGNHDVGDKPGEWLPAQSITSPFLAKYRSIFGADFASFNHNDCHFIIINAQLLNSGLPEEADQRDWLTRDLQQHAGKRMFVFMHYPPFITDADEIGHYDNVDEPARSWLLDLLADYDAEALFAGHVHNFFYNRHRGAHHYIAPSLAFVRQDYSEMFRIAPEVDMEFGRNDSGKLGFFMVDVYPDHHTVRVERDYLDIDETITAAEALQEAVRLPSVASAPSIVGVDSRQVWAERTEVPYGGVVDEFARKPVRSDYPLMAMWEMGISRLRIPLHDLLDAETRARMIEVGDAGHRFQVFSYGLPDAKATALLAKYAGLISGIEVIQPPSRLEQPEQIEGFRNLRETTGIDVFLSIVHTSAGGSHGGDGYAHFIRHGFNSGDCDNIRALAAAHRGAISGFAFTVMREEQPASALASINALMDGLGLRAIALVRLSASEPGSSVVDDAAIAGRVAHAIFAAHGSDLVAVTLDTFADIDRGYFPRNGLTDRRYNLRAAGRVVKHLSSTLPLTLQGGRELSSGVAQGIEWTRVGDNTLLVPISDGKEASDETANSAASAADSARFRVDLDRGYSVPAEDTGTVELDSPVLLHQGMITAGVLV